MSFKSCIPCFLVLLLIACQEEQSQSEHLNIDVQEEKSRLLRHVVLFNFSENATPDTIQIIEQAFASLPEKISQIQSFEWGTNNSPEGLDKGFTHCYLISFTSEEDRDAYLPHPAHLEFVEFVKPYLEDVTVVDYWAD